MITRLAHRPLQASLRQSMGACGNCYDNAFAESAVSSIKSELFVDQVLFDSKTEAATLIFDSLEAFHNRGLQIRGVRHNYFRPTVWQ